MTAEILARLQSNATNLVYWTMHVKNLLRPIRRWWAWPDPQSLVVPYGGG